MRDSTVPHAAIAAGETAPQHPRAVIASLEFTNFKVLRAARVELRPFNLLIGPNGSGKSSLFAALHRLSRAAGRVSTRQLRLPALAAEATSIRFHFAPPFADVEALLECTASGVATVLHVAAPDPARWDHLAARLATLRVVSLEQAALRRPSAPGAPIQLGDDGGNLPAALKFLEREDPDAFTQIVGEFRRILPEYRSIGVNAADDGSTALFAEIVGEERVLEAEDLSQGTLALLGLLVLVHGSPSPALLCLEEIDRGIHPRLLRELKDLLYRLANPEDGRPGTQVITTTHSPYLLDLFRDQLEEIVVAQKRGTEATFDRLSDRLDLREAIGDANLGDLWYSGIFGGVPEES